MNIDFLPALIILIPLLIASIISLSNNVVLNRFIAISSLIIINLIAFKLVYLTNSYGPIYYVFGRFEKFIAVEYKVGLFNAYFLSLISIISLFVISQVKRNFSIFLFTITGMLGITVTNDIFNLYVFLEICSLSSYGLIAINKSKESLVSALQYLIYGTIGACFILIGIGLILMITGSLNMDIAAFELNQTQHILIKNLSLVFITIGIFFKLALFPMYGWLPRLYQNIDVIVASLLSSLMPCLYFYMLSKFYFSIFDFNNLPKHFIQILSYISLATILAGSIFSLFFKNLRELWGYSSISNIGYGVLFITLGKIALPGLIILISIHAFLKLSLFLVTEKIETHNKLTNILLIMNTASLVGLPFTAGFINKWNLLTLNSSNYLNLAIISISSVFSVLYFIKLIEKYKFKSYTTANPGLLIIFLTLVNLLIAFPDTNFTLFIQKVAQNI